MTDQPASSDQQQDGPRVTVSLDDLNNRFSAEVAAVAKRAVLAEEQLAAYQKAYAELWEKAQELYGIATTQQERITELEAELKKAERAGKRAARSKATPAPKDAAPKE